MTRRGMGWMLLTAILVSGGAWMAGSASGQAQPGKPRPKPQQASARPGVQAAGHPAREITLTGRVVTVQSYMMPSPGSADSTRAVTDSLRAGGAAALESPMGLVILGQGNTGGMRLLLPLADQQVEIHGKLFEKGGVKHLDIDTIDAVEEDQVDLGDEDGDEEGDGGE